jgi:hypothetical protein
MLNGTLSAGARRIARKKHGWIRRNSYGLSRIVLANQADTAYSRRRNGSSPTFGGIFPTGNDESGSFQKQKRRFAG